MVTCNVLYGKVNRSKNFSIINSSALHRLFPSSFVSLSRNLFTTLILHDIAIRKYHWTSTLFPFNPVPFNPVFPSLKHASLQPLSSFYLQLGRRPCHREREREIIIDKSIKKNMQIRNDINDLVSEVHIVIFHQTYLTNVLLTFPVHCYVRDKNVFDVNHSIITLYYTLKRIM